jgi:hypothetical protein
VGDDPVDTGADTSDTSSDSGSIRAALPQRRIERAAPQVVSSADGDDRGFDELLPFASSGGALPDGGEGGGADERAVLIPLAGGALLLVLSAMAWYANRRSELALEGVPVEELGDVHTNGNGNGYGGGHVTAFRAVPESGEWDDDLEVPLVGAGRRRR